MLLIRGLLLTIRPLPIGRLYGVKKTISGPLKNEQIRIPQILLIKEDNTRTGPHRPTELLQSIDRQKFDLVLVNPNHDPPLTRLISKSQQFNRLQNQSQQKLEQRLKCREKEVRFDIGMAKHDESVRWRRVQDWLGKAWRVKIVVTGKLIEREQLNRKLLERLRGELGRDLVIIGAPEATNGSLITIVQNASAKPSLIKNKHDEETGEGEGEWEEGEGERKG